MKNKYLPDLLRARLEGRDTLRRVFDNSFWLFCEQLVRMAAGLLVGVWVARYLGPESYGWLNYAAVTVGLVTSFAAPAVSAVVVRELARAPAETGGWMGVTFFVRTAGATLGFLVCLAIAWRHSGAGTPAAELIPIVAAGVLLQTADVADLWLQARGESRMTAWIRIAACVFGSGLRVALILGKAPLLAFAFAGLVEPAVAAVGWGWALCRRGHGLATWMCEASRVRELLRESWPLTVSGWAVIAQAYVDQLVIGVFVGAEELGQYAAAMRLVNVFTFVPMVIYTVSAPEIARAKRDDEALYQRRLHSLYRVMFGVFLATAVPLILFGSSATRGLFGDKYGAAASFLPWLALRLFFTNFGVARGVFLANEGLLGFGLITALLGAVVNVALNLVLIPHFRAWGAIIAATASFFVTTFAVEAFNARARANLGLMLRAIFFPWRQFTP